MSPEWVMKLVLVASFQTDLHFVYVAITGKLSGVVSIQQLSENVACWAFKGCRPLLQALQKTTRPIPTVAIISPAALRPTAGRCFISDASLAKYDQVFQEAGRHLPWLGFHSLSHSVNASRGHPSLQWHWLTGWLTQREGERANERASERASVRTVRWCTYVSFFCFLPSPKRLFNIPLGEWHRESAHCTIISVNKELEGSQWGCSWPASSLLYSAFCQTWFLLYGSRPVSSPLLLSCFNLMTPSFLLLLLLFLLKAPPLFVSASDILPAPEDDERTQSCAATSMRLSLCLLTASTLPTSVLWFHFSSAGNLERPSQQLWWLKWLMYMRVK